MICIDRTSFIYLSLREHPSIRQDESSRQETVSTDRIIDCDALQCTTLRPAPKSSTDDSGSPLRTETIGMRRRKLPRRERTRRVVTNPNDRSGFTGHNGGVGLLLPDS